MSERLTLPTIVPVLPYQKAAILSPARFTWHNWSRQVGKSFAFGLKRLMRALERKRLQVLLSAGERQSRELMTKVQQHCQALKVAATLREDTYFEGTAFKQLELHLPDRVRILALPANPNTARGFTGDVFLDEFAMHQHDREIWAALYPTVMRGEGELDIASTPKGKSNMFYTLQSNPAFERTTVTIEDAVRDGLKVDIDELRRGMGDPDLWRQEFLCEFLDAEHALLTYEQIAECEDQTLDLPVGLDGWPEAVRRIESAGTCYVGGDIGRHRDLTVFWAVAERDNELTTPAIIELRGVPFRTQWEVLQSLLGLRNVQRCALDASGLGMQLAEQAVEQFGGWKVEPVTFSLQTKTEMAEGLRVKVEDAAIRIPVSAEIRNEWHSIRRAPTVTGTFRYLAERTELGHADRFWAAALAVRAAAQASGPAEYVGTERKLVFARAGIW